MSAREPIDFNESIEQVESLIQAIEAGADDKILTAAARTLKKDRKEIMECDKFQKEVKTNPEAMEKLLKKCIDDVGPVTVKGSGNRMMFFGER